MSKTGNDSRPVVDLDLEKLGAENPELHWRM